MQAAGQQLNSTLKSLQDINSSPMSPASTPAVLDTLSAQLVLPLGEHQDGMPLNHA